MKSQGFDKILGAGKLELEKFEKDPIRREDIESVDIDQRFINSINKEVINPIIVRKIGDNLFVIDGMRRIKASKKLDKSKIKTLVVKATDVQALECHITVNYANIWRKTVSNSDREKSLEKYSELKNISVKEAKIELGLLTQKDEMENELQEVYGVGEKTIQKIKKEFNNIEELKSSSLYEISNTGISKEKAKIINQNFN